MKIHRFIDPSFNLDQSTLVVTNSEIINQWVNVLRFKISEKIVVCNGSGFESEAVIMKITDDGIELALAGKIKNQNEPKREVNLYCAVLKKENFETVVQKSVEVGVTRIVPIMTERTIKQNVRIDRLVKIAHEAAEQSGRGIVPVITETMNFSEAITEAGKTGEIFFFDLGSDKDFSKQLHGVKPVNIFIGPEGGFSESEVAAAHKAGSQVVSLGSLTLRGETAAIIAGWIGARRDVS